jgi:hypothetical protein
MIRRTDVSDKAREVVNANEYSINHSIYVRGFARMVQTSRDVRRRLVATNNLASITIGVEPICQ